MINFKKTAIFLIKISYSLLLSSLFVLITLYTIYQIFFHFDIKLLFPDLMIITFNILLLWYINWVIWTKGLVRKIIMQIIVFFIFILTLSAMKFI